MRVTIAKPNVYDSYGISLPQGSIQTVDNTFGQFLVYSLQAADTDGVLPFVPNNPYSTTSAAGITLELAQGATDVPAVSKLTVTGATLTGPANNATLVIPPSSGSSTFAASCAYTLPAGASHNLGPAPTSGVFTAGTTNRFIVTPNAGGSNLDSITAPGTDGFVILLYNPSLTLSLALLDKANAATTGSAGNLLACPNPNGLAANAIQVFLPPQSAQKLTYYANVWVFA